MIPAWLLIAFYGVAGLAAVTLVVRWMLARRSQSPAGDAQSPSGGNGAHGHAATASADSASQSWANRRLFEGLNTHADVGSDEFSNVDYETLPNVGSGDYVFGLVTPSLAALLPESDTRREMLKKELRAAGYFQPHAWHNLAAIRYLAIMAAIVGCGTLLIVAPPAAEFPIIISMVALAALGWAVPRLYVKNRAVERTNEVERGMPDLLDMMNMCVSQGLTVQESLKRVSVELRPVYPALGRELAIISEQAEVGTLEQALGNFSDRIDVPEVRSFTSLLIQTERMGTSVSEALTEYSDNMRESLRQRADEKANKATFKLLFPTVLCLMPAVYMFLLGPAIIELSNFMSDGRNLLDTGQQAVERFNEGR